MEASGQHVDNARYDDALKNAHYMRSSTARSPYGFNSTATVNYDNAENAATATSNNYEQQPLYLWNRQQQQVAMGNRDATAAKKQQT